MRIVAVNDDGPGTPVDVSGTPMAIPGPPRAVGAFSVDGGLLVSWGAPWNGGSPITEYRVQWKGPGEDYDHSERQAVLTDLDNLNHQITGLTNGDVYTVRVVAANVNGDSRTSEVSGTPAAAPGAPRSLAAATSASGGPLVSYHIRLSWQAPGETGASPITGYRVQRKRPWDNEYNSGEVVTKLSRPSFSFLYACVDCEGRQFQFRVTAVNSDGVGPPAEVTGTLAADTTSGAAGVLGAGSAGLGRGVRQPAGRSDRAPAPSSYRPLRRPAPVGLPGPPATVTGQRSERRPVAANGRSGRCGDAR